MYTHYIVTNFFAIKYKNWSFYANVLRFLKHFQHDRLAAMTLVMIAHGTNGPAMFHDIQVGWKNGARKPVENVLLSIMVIAAMVITTKAITLMELITLTETTTAMEIMVSD